MLHLVFKFSTFWSHHMDIVSRTLGINHPAIRSSICSKMPFKASFVERRARIHTGRSEGSASLIMNSTSSLGLQLAVSRPIFFSSYQWCAGVYRALLQSYPHWFVPNIRNTMAAIHMKWAKEDSVYRRFHFTASRPIYQAPCSFQSSLNEDTEDVYAQRGVGQVPRSFGNVVGIISNQSLRFCGNHWGQEVSYGWCLSWLRYSLRQDHFDDVTSLSGTTNSLSINFFNAVVCTSTATRA